MKSELEIIVNTYGSKLEVEHTSIHDDIRHNIARKLIDLEEQAIRETLIKLGWTPPNEIITHKKITHPKVVCLCGSTKEKIAFEKAMRDEALKGNAVFTVAQYSHADNLILTQEEKDIFDKRHLFQIDKSDEVFVLNVGGYIGESTQKEINYAKGIGKKVRYLEENK